MKLGSATKESFMIDDTTDVNNMTFEGSVGESPIRDNSPQTPEAKRDSE